MIYSAYTTPDGSAIARIAAFKPEGGNGEYHVAITVTEPGLPLLSQLHSVQRALSWVQRTMLPDASMVFKRYFLSDLADQSQYLPSEPDCAVSMMPAEPYNGTKVALWAYLIQDAQLRRTDWGAFVAQHGNYRLLVATNMANPGLDHRQATAQLIKQWGANMLKEGCSLYDHCMRTWLMVSDIEAKYADVVSSRMQTFEQYGLNDKTHYIVNTSINGVFGDSSLALSMDALGLAGIMPDQVQYLHAEETLGSAHNTGLAYERGVKVDYGDRCHVLIAGTASVDSEGAPVHKDDVLSQATRMLANVEALLADAKCGWDDVAQAIIYLRDPADYERVAWLLSLKLPKAPYVIVQAHVRHPEWLIEMECVAIRSQINYRFTNF